jgi:hypothetical protein
MSSAIASLRMENGTKGQFDPQQKRNATSGSAQRMRLSYYGVCLFPDRQLLLASFFRQGLLEAPDPNQLRVLVRRVTTLQLGRPQ